MFSGLSVDRKLSSGRSATCRGMTPMGKRGAGVSAVAVAATAARYLTFRVGLVTEVFVVAEWIIAAACSRRMRFLSSASLMLWRVNILMYESTGRWFLRVADRA